MPTPTTSPESLARDLSLIEELLVEWHKQPLRLTDMGRDAFNKLLAAARHNATLTTALAERDKRISELEAAANAWGMLQSMIEAYAEPEMEDIDGDRVRTIDGFIAVYQRQKNELAEERRQKAELAAKWRAEARDCHGLASTTLGGPEYTRLRARAVAFEEAADELLADKPTP